MRSFVFTMVENYFFDKMTGGKQDAKGSGSLI
jgi:hypothetical protein